MQSLNAVLEVCPWYNAKALVAVFQFLVLTLAVALPLHAREQVTLMASDGVKVFADFYPADSKSRLYILLFHQAGSNRAEYASIAPRLVKLGFNCLAIDQRSGGDLWGQQNETVRRLGRSAEYTDAIKDLERLWPGQDLLEAMPKSSFGAAVILQLLSSFWLHNIAKRLREYSAFPRTSIWEDRT